MLIRTHSECLFEPLGFHSRFFPFRDFSVVSSPLGNLCLTEAPFQPFGVPYTKVSVPFGPQITSTSGLPFGFVPHISKFQSLWDLKFLHPKGYFLALSCAAPIKAHYLQVEHLPVFGATDGLRNLCLDSSPLGTGSESFCLIEAPFQPLWGTIRPRRGDSIPLG